MVVCARSISVCVVMRVQVEALRRIDPRSLTHCLKDQETEKAARAQQRDAEPQTDRHDIKIRAFVYTVSFV